MEVVRQLNLDDLEQMINLRIKIQKYDLKYIDSNSIVLSQDELQKKTREYLKKSINNNLFMFGYFIDDKLVANCGFYVDKHFPTYNNPSGITGYICNVFTLEEYRNNGYQKKTFNVCFDYAKKMGITSFKLSSMNESAINMYKSFGFNNNNHTYTCKVQEK